MKLKKIKEIKTLTRFDNCEKSPKRFKKIIALSKNIQNFGKKLNKYFEVFM